jgi:simple sugar transport system permease protein
MSGPAAAVPAVADERLARRSPLRRLAGRPEIGALLGAVALFALFSVAADAFLRASSLSTVLYASSTFGIMAVSVALLMIGGEFDLSAGVMVTTGALVAAMTSYQLTLNVWAGVAISLVVTLGLGLLNGLLYVRTGLPSFIVTLGTFLMLAGANLGVTKLVTGNVATDSIRDMDGFAAARAVFAADLDAGGVRVNVTVLWWLAFVAAATWLLLRTRAGNWIFACGGAPDSARAVGVPVARVKVALFMGVAFTAWFSGMHLLFAYASVQSGEGVGNEFFYIICAVIGGCLLTGGYGSAIGAAIGAFIFGMTNKGIVYAEWNPDWFKFFLGAMLLLATVVNLAVRRRAEPAR